MPLRSATRAAIASALDVLVFLARGASPGFWLRRAVFSPALDNLGQRPGRLAHSKRPDHAVDTGKRFLVGRNENHQRPQTYSIAVA